MDSVRVIQQPTSYREGYKKQDSDKFSRSAFWSWQSDDRIACAFASSCLCADLTVCKYMSLLAEHTEEQIWETSLSSCLHSSGEIGSEGFLSQCDWWRLLEAMAAEKASCPGGGGKLKLPETMLSWESAVRASRASVSIHSPLNLLTLISLPPLTYYDAP